MNDLIKQENTDFSPAIQRLKDAEDYVKYIKNTSVYAAPFVKKVKQDDGTEIEVVNEADIMACIVIGMELGIPPMTSLTLGKALNKQAYLKSEMGKAFGLSTIESLDQINVIPTKNGDITHVGYKTLARGLIQQGIKFEYLEDYAPIYCYRKYDWDTVNKKFTEPVMVANEIDSKELYDDIYNERVDNIFILGSLTTKEALKGAILGNLIILKKEIYTYRTTVKFDRAGFAPLIISYTLQEATDAELYKGFHSKDIDASGKPYYVDGKDNWNKHPRTMLRGRPLAIGARLISGNAIANVYLHEEAAEITNTVIDITDKKE